MFSDGERVSNEADSNRAERGRKGLLIGVKEFKCWESARRSALRRGQRGLIRLAGIIRQVWQDLGIPVGCEVRSV
jgi:hypothetical protein